MKINLVVHLYFDARAITTMSIYLRHWTGQVARGKRGGLDYTLTGCSCSNLLTGLEMLCFPTFISATLSFIAIMS